MYQYIVKVAMWASYVKIIKIKATKVHHLVYKMLDNSEKFPRALNDVFTLIVLSVRQPTDL